MLSLTRSFQYAFFLHFLLLALVLIWPAQAPPKKRVQVKEVRLVQERAAVAAAPTAAAPPAAPTAIPTVTPVAKPTEAAPPTEKPTTKPAAPPATPKKEVKQPPKPKAEKKETPKPKAEKKETPKIKTEPKEPTKKESNRQKLAKALKDSLAKMERSEAPSSSQQITELGTIDRLSFTTANESDGYSPDLIKSLKLQMQLPEMGQVKLDLTLKSSGEVLSFDIIDAKSSINRKYVEKRLPSLHLPPLKGSYAGQTKQTFTLTLNNDHL